MKHENMIRKTYKVKNKNWTWKWKYEKLSLKNWSWTCKWKVGTWQMETWNMKQTYRYRYVYMYIRIDVWNVNWESGLGIAHLWETWKTKPWKLKTHTLSRSWNSSSNANLSSIFVFRGRRQRAQPFWVRRPRGTRAAACGSTGDQTLVKTS